MKYSRSQIVATIGPASGDKEILQRMAKHQMDLARLNFSWGTHEEHAQYIQMIREVADESGKTIRIIQDLSGPREQGEDGHQFDENKKIITEKDIKDLVFGIEQDLDYVAMSYVGNAKDVEDLRAIMKAKGKVIPIIAKIERGIALENLDAIIAVSDGIMIARGDLGISIPLERVPFAQRFIIKKAKAAHKPVITATEMLLSMTNNMKPTRAEVSDVAHAILDGSDAVMLSEETARGSHPVEAVKIMERIVIEAEKHRQQCIEHLL